MHTQEVLSSNFRLYAVYRDRILRRFSQSLQKHARMKHNVMTQPLHFTSFINSVFAKYHHLKS